MSAPAPEASSAGGDSLRCSDCGGRIQADGYCDDCGAAPPEAGAAPAGAGAETGTTTRRILVERLIDRPSTRPMATTRTRIGGGVVHVEPASGPDPSEVILEDPQVPESHRRCQNCENPVGRTRPDRPGRTRGFCSGCGNPFDFEPQLKPGDLVAGQYRVEGAMAHGGMGWIYLARDLNVSERPCVLKGVIALEDEAAREAAAAERRELAKLSHHQNIVSIHNYVNHDPKVPGRHDDPKVPGRHDDPKVPGLRGQSDSGAPGDAGPDSEAPGYIVMEYLGGHSLRQVREAQGEPLPAPQAISYMLAVLPAFSDMHRQGRVFCDFKPDNVMHVGDEVKLIDLGGVRRLDDEHSPIFGTYGYQAPEVPWTGPTVTSDLYTIGRALAVLLLDWPDWQRGDRERLPRRENHALLVEHDCLWRFLRRACHADPEQRFADADEMADQLDGVLHQVAARVDGTVQPYASLRWGPPQPTLDRLTWSRLPRPVLPDHPERPNRIAGVAEGDTAIQIAERIAGNLSWADAAAVALAHCATDTTRAASYAAQVDPDDPVGAPYRAVLQAARLYLDGIISLAENRIDAASDRFNQAYSIAPGEPACALACAVVLEERGHRTQFPVEMEARGLPDIGHPHDPPQVRLAGHEAATQEAELDPAAAALFAEATALYDQVVTTYPSWVGAVAGLARSLKAQRRHTDAAQVFLAVPKAHPLRAEALVRACNYMDGRQLDVAAPLHASYDEVVATAAGAHLEPTQPRHRPAAEAELAVALYTAALAALNRGETVGSLVAGHPPEPAHLSLAAEQAMIELADRTPDRSRRHELLDQAARTRPWTFW